MNRAGLLLDWQLLTMLAGDRLLDPRLRHWCQRMAGRTLAALNPAVPA